MNKSVGTILAVVILILAGVTVFAARTYQGELADVPEGQIVLATDGAEKIIRFSDMKLSDMSGDMKNGKGETKHIEGKGVLIADVVGKTDFSEAVVIADDAYRAVVTPEDLENAWMLVNEEGARLVVFGDDNAKRDVKNVVRIEVK